MRKLVIQYCDDCPHFDNQYYGYNEKCKLLDKVIPSDNYKEEECRYVRDIPEECPLEIV